jgi:predicted MFS family arabinose efflux permease
VLLTLATTLLWATGSFTFFTYVGVILHQTASAGASGLAGFLLVFGLAGLAGAAAAGWLADKTGPLPALAAGLTLTALSLAGLGVIAAVAAGPRRGHRQRRGDCQLRLRHLGDHPAPTAAPALLRRQ